MANALELLGQKDLQLAEAHEQYEGIWNVLRRLKAGEIDLSQVEVGTNPAGQRTWKVEPKRDNGAVNRIAAITADERETDE